MSEKRMGSSIDTFLKEEGIFEETQAQAIKEVVAWQLAEAMTKGRISKKQDGEAAEDEPHTGGPVARSEQLCDARQSSAGGRHGRAPREHRVGVIGDKRNPSPSR